MPVIEVVYNDGMFGFVSPLELDCLIEAEEIVKFLRGDVWIYPGVDPTRSSVCNPISKERRFNI
jgi:hypothetical protein